MRAPPISTRPATLFPYRTLFRSWEIPSAPERDEAVAARRNPASLLVADMKRAPMGAPDRSRPFEPLLRSDEGRAIAFGPAIIFIDDRPQPLDHPVLDLDRTRRGGVDDLLQRGQVMSLERR